MVTPCHTRNHSLFLVRSGAQSMLFTGDCIFHGGVGKFFEGSAAEMQLILQTRDKMIPADALCFYGHDYGLRNLNWASFLLQQRAIKSVQSE
jgi:hydroxyacylglutathione hydrolase